MHHRLIRKKKSEYRKYFISYCCIALIPVIIIALAAFFLLRFYYANTSQELFRRSVTQFADHIDSNVHEFQVSVSGLSLDLEHENAAADEQIISCLRILENSNVLHATTCFYRIGSMDIYTPDGRVSYQKYEADMSDRFSTNYSSFFTHLNSAMSLTILPLYTAPGTQNLSDVLAVLVPYYGSKPSERGVFAFITESAELLSDAEGYISTVPEYFYLYAPNLTLLSAAEAAPQSPAVRLDMLRSVTGMVSRFTLASLPQDVLHYKTNLNGLHVVLGTSLDGLYFNLADISRRMLLILIPSLAALTALAFLLANYSYRPIRALLNTVGSGREEIPPDSGELEYIGNHLKTIHSQVQQLNQTIEAQQPYVRSQLLSGLLRGSTDPEEVQTIFPSLSPDSPAYVILTLPGDRNPSLLQACVNDVHLEGVTLQGVWMEGDDCFAFLCFPETADDQREDQCLELYDQLLTFGIESPHLFVGSLVEGLQKLPTSFLEAYLVLNSRARKEHEPISVYRADSEETHTDSAYVSTRHLELYLQALQSVDFHAASAFLDSLLESMTATMPYGSKLFSSYMRFNLYSNALSHCEPEVVEQFSGQNVSVELYNSEELFLKFMQELTESNCRAVEAKRSSELQKKRESILTLIHAHCFEADFSVARLSEMVGYSPTYINHFLRDETGLTYIQYVSRVRLEKAKQMLAQTDIKIRDIVPQCGYVDLASFTRKFKEYTGVTPSEYRVQHQSPDPS